MREIAYLTLLIIVIGCGQSVPEKASVPSPLITADPDRLWILARVSKVGDGRECKAHYLQPDDPRYQGLKQKCDFWSRNYADYLSINGFPSVEHIHLQDREYWLWYAARREQIATCKSNHKSPLVGTPREQRDSIRKLRNACDPYDHALQNKNRSPTDLGIRFN